MSDARTEVVAEAAVEAVAATAASEAARQTAAATIAVVDAARTETDATVTAAETAVALANATAAAAELDAAERMRELVQGLVTWQSEVAQTLAMLAEQVRTTQEAMTAQQSLMQSEVNSLREQLSLILPTSTTSETGETQAVVVTPAQVTVQNEGGENPDQRTVKRIRRLI